ncbi:NAD(P)/FAD-dependent oxidoreductase [Salipiger profundus]|uniref:NAD(P)/FAD-dependent oxidoreductase n=1 Tax=Salipiger profundus TaxID=1229727 RepID=UPI0008F30167|nr:FAD-binding oxidoreductase [Salipiger profundus]SFD74574.1 Glycine/D-amino acid oxidase [Salipiger profundus]
MPGPTPVHVQGDPELPEKVDVVVIGGGIIGSSTALELAEAGYSVAVCEKGGIGHEQSSRNWGWVRITRRDPREIPLMAESLRLWKTIDERLGRSTGYRTTGITFVCKNEKMVENYRNWKRHLEPFQIKSEILSPQEMRDLNPGSQLTGAGALHTPADGRAEPQKAAPAIAEAARDRGAHILTKCAVRTVETEGGRVSGVVTERGPIRCSSVVLAGGAWSNLFAGNMGIDLPALGVVSHVLRTEPIEGGPKEATWTNDFAIRKREDGGYTISRGAGTTVDIVPNSFRYAAKYLRALKMQGRELHFRISEQFLREARRAKKWSSSEVTPFEEDENRIFDPMPSPKMVNSLLANASAAFPALKDAKVAQKWAGCIDVTPDAIPVISEVKATPGLYMATGFSGHGFGIGPAAGGLMADLVTGRTPRVDPKEFRFSRFTDGSRIAPDLGY